MKKPVKTYHIEDNRLIKKATKLFLLEFVMALFCLGLLFFSLYK